MARGKKTKEKRRRGRGFTTEQFIGHVEKHASGGGGLFLNLKKAGKLIGFIHPVIGILPRKIRASAIPTRIEKDGDVEVKNRRFNEADPPDHDPITGLIDFAEQKIEDGVGDDTLVLNGGQKGKWSLGDLAQLNADANYRTSLKLKTEYVIAFVQRTEDRPDDNPVQILFATPSLGKAIQRVIKQEMEERGSNVGDPMESPYGFRLTYDKDEGPANMYDAARVDDHVCPLDEETREILEMDGDEANVDIEVHAQPGHIGDMTHAIESTWDCDVIPFAEFKEFMGEGVSGEDDSQPDDSSKDDSASGEVDDPPPCWGEYEDDDADCQACDLCDECERKTKGGKKSPKKTGKGKQFGKDGGKAKCPECKKLVTPNAKDKCPNCLAKLNSDVPL